MIEYGRLLANLLGWDLETMDCVVKYTDANTLLSTIPM
jgi:hypothetical protein